MDTVALKPLHSLLFPFLWHLDRFQMIPIFNINLYEVCHAGAHSAIGRAPDS